MNVADWFARNRLELQAAGIIAALFAVGIILVDGPMIPVAAQDTETPPTFPVATVAAPDSLTVPPAVLVESGAATSPPQRLDSFQATPTTTATPQDVVNNLPYEFMVAEPAMQAYTIVAGFRGWDEATITAWAPFVRNVMYGESGFCWNRLRGSVMPYPADGCREARAGTHSDAGFGQITPIAGYRSDLWMCQDHGICSRWDIIADPWHSMLALVLALEYHGSQPWCYNSAARRYHDCTLAPGGKP